MADIFLSYARADRDRVAQLAAALEDAGYTVWWDRHIKGGHDFSKDIEAELTAASAVVVAWSKQSVDSHWVRDEAGAGRDAGKLVPLSIDGALPPMGFRQVHTIDCSKSSDQYLPELDSALRSIVGGQRREALVEKPKPRWRPIVLATLVLLVAVAAATYFYAPAVFDRNGERHSEEAAKSLVILPFEILGSEEQAYLGQGLASALSNDLSVFPELQIIAGTSANAMRAQSLGPGEIGDQFGIHYVIEGTVRPERDRLYVTARLVDGMSSEQLWSGEIESDVNDVQALQQDLVLALAPALRTRLSLTDADVAAADKVPPAAYSAYLRGLDAINRRAYDGSEPLRREGYRSLTTAVSVSPEFADAWAARAYLGIISDPIIMGTPPERQHQIISEDIERALELDPENPLALSTKARLKVVREAEIEEAVALAESVLAKRPDFGPALYAITSAYLTGGDNRELLRWSERLRANDPFNRAHLATRVIAEYRLDDYQQFLDYLAACELCPNPAMFAVFAGTGLATTDELQRDKDTLTSNLLAEMPASFAQPYNETLVAIAEGTGASDATLDWLLGMGLPEMALASRLGAPDRALDAAQALVASPRYDAGLLAIIMIDARISFPPELRADPRYHALFDSVSGRNMIAYRKANGIKGGLPLAKDEVLIEKQRLGPIAR